jgi:hypothetical protein
MLHVILLTPRNLRWLLHLWTPPTDLICSKFIHAQFVSVIPKYLHFVTHTESRRINFPTVKSLLSHVTLWYNTVINGTSTSFQWKHSRMGAHNKMKMRHTNTKLSLYFSKTHSSIFTKHMAFWYHLYYCSIQFLKIIIKSHNHIFNCLHVTMTGLRCLCQ